MYPAAFRLCWFQCDIITPYTVHRRADPYHQILVRGSCIPSRLKPTTSPYVLEAPLLAVSFNIGIVLGCEIGQQRSSREGPSTDVSPFRGPSSLKTPTLSVVAQILSRKRFYRVFTNLPYKGPRMEPQKK